MSYQAYLAAEEHAAEKHEWVNGEVFAMAGGTVEHARLQMAVGATLLAQLRGRPCVVLSSDARVRVGATGLSTYPDVSVVCGKVETAEPDPHGVLNPVVIVEVLSDGTEAYDRGEKFAHYRRLESLREYVLVSQRGPRIEVFRREEGGWTLHEWGPGETAHLASVDAALAVDEVYRDPLAP
ncbi:MAG: Uma2 family endonuclease [Deltaproteobacteria bacterium]|nr:Uma2 family endonuclease [Deltaproteobacteria bacterium]